MTLSFRFSKTRQIDHIWHFWLAFVHSKCNGVFYDFQTPCKGFQRDSNWFSRRSKVRFIEFKRSKLETKKDRKSSKIIEKCSGNMEKWCDEWKKVIEGSNYLLDIWLWLPSFAGTKFCNWCPPAYLHISSQMSSHIISVISTRAETLIFIHSVWKSQKMSHLTSRAKRAKFTFWVDTTS